MKCGSGLTHTWKSWQNKCGRWMRSFEVLAERKYGKLNFRSLAVKAEQKCGSRTSHLWKSRQRWNAEVDLPIFGSPGRTSAKMNEIFRSPGRAEVRKAELQIFGSKDRAELRKRSFRPLKVLAELKCRSWTSDRWQPRQDRSAGAELHILRRIGRAQVRNWLHVTSLVVRPNGSAGAEFQIFGSPVTLEVWKQNFTSLTSSYPTDCHWQCWQITLLTAIIVIPSEGQCQDQVWLKHRTFAMLLTRSLCSRRDSG